MKILSLEISNFLAVGDSGKLNLADQGLVLVQGANLDDSSAASNGVGKSSIPDALSWALFGETARGISGDAVVNKTRKKNCMVRVYIQVGENTYSVERFRKHAEYKNQIRLWLVPGSDISGGTDKQTQEKIDSIIGCSKDVFMSAIYAGQETAPDLPSMTDKQLKLLIEEAAGVEKIEAALTIARARHGSAVAEHRTVISAQESRAQRIADLQVSIDSTTLLHKSFEAARATKKQSHLDSAATFLATAKRLQTQQAALGDPKVVGARIVTIEKQMASFKELDALARAAEAAVTKQQSMVDRSKHNMDVQVEAALTIKRQIDAGPTGAMGPCSECGKPHTADEIEDYTKHLQVRLQKAVEQGQACKHLWLEDKKHQDKLKATADETRFEVTDVAPLSAELARITRLWHEINGCDVNIHNNKRQARDSMDAAKIALVEPNPHAVTIKELQTRKDEIAGTLRDLEATIDAVTKRVAVLDVAVKVFGPAGVRAHILDTVTPFLNTQTADYLSALSDGNISATWATLSTTAKGDLREKFNIEVTNLTGAESFAGLSGGEKRKVRLATMLALQDLVATRASNPIQLWLGDEIDDALDGAGLERLMGVLERKAREKGTVLMISHRDLSDWADRVVTVTKQDGVSTITGALSE